MQKENFLQLQYTALRDEIQQTQKRIYIILALSALGVPPIQTFAIEFKVEALIFAIPIVVFAFMILFTEENQAMMRCGQYIKEHIESAAEGVVGWEHWLEESAQRRSSNVYVAVCAYFILFVHYLVGVSAAAQAAPSFGEGWRASLLVTYTLLGVWVVIYLVKSFRLTVSTKR